MTGNLSTGLDVLDRKLDGGLPLGRIVVLTASPASQSELLLRKFAQAQPCQYLTTERSAAGIEGSLTAPATNGQPITITAVDHDEPLTNASRLIRDFPDETTVIIDPINTLEEQPVEPYRAFLNELKEHVVETDKVAVLHGLEDRTVPEQRDRTEYHADTVMNLHTAVRGGVIENSLRIPKFRGGAALNAEIDLNLTTDVAIDVTRKIA